MKKKFIVNGPKWKQLNSVKCAAQHARGSQHQSSFPYSYFFYFTFSKEWLRQKAYKRPVSRWNIREGYEDLPGISCIQKKHRQTPAHPFWRRRSRDRTLLEENRVWRTENVLELCEHAGLHIEKARWIFNDTQLQPPLPILVGFKGYHNVAQDDKYKFSY